MRVLVAEDSRSLAEVLAEGLRDQGMAVDVAFDGLEAAASWTPALTTSSCSTATCLACTATRYAR
jgi:DNA-binding response OmpR family regulator